MLSLLLKRVGPVRGIYGVNKNAFPSRAAYMHPAAALAFMRMEKEVGPFVYSDILRGPDESLAACRAGRGSQAPGFSGHNFGLAFDLAVDQVMQEKRWRYERLCANLATYGFYPYRQDRTRGPEDWHFNYLGESAQMILRATSARHLWQTAAEESIRASYPNITPMGAVDIQTALKKLHLYTGEVDGSLGPLSMTAVNLFNRTWDLTPNVIGERFQRTLAYVASDKLMEDA